MAIISLDFPEDDGAGQSPRSLLADRLRLWRYATQLRPEMVAPPPLTERRAAERKRLILAIGKFCAEGREHFCFVRDVSLGGLRIEGAHLPDPGAEVVVEMRGMPPTRATVQWRRDEIAGLAWTDDADLTGVLRPAAVEPGAPTARSPRFQVGAIATLVADGREHIVTVVDVSVGGAKLEGVTAGPPTAGQLNLGGRLPTLSGYLRWSRGEFAGFRFTPPLGRDTLVQILERSEPA